MDAARDWLLYRIDPSRSFNQIQQEIKAIHMQAHAIMPANSQRRRSSAKYPIYVNASAYNLYRVLKVWGDKIDQFNIKQGEPLTVSIDLESREYNGRWYTDVKAWKVSRDGVGAGNSQSYSHLDDYGSTSTVSSSLDGDDIPF